jgi:hypothetical protein
MKYTRPEVQGQEYDSCSRRSHVKFAPRASYDIDSTKGGTKYMAAQTHYRLIQNNSEKIGGDLVQATMSGGKPILMTTQLTAGNVITVYIIVEYSRE